MPESTSESARLAEQLEQILANDWHQDQCACVGWPKRCVGLTNPVPPMTWTVEAVLDALSRVPKPGDLAEDAALHVEHTGHSVTWSEECGLWGCHDCSWTDPNAPTIPPAEPKQPPAHSCLTSAGSPTCTGCREERRDA